VVDEVDGPLSVAPVGWVLPVLEPGAVLLEPVEPAAPVDGTPLELVVPELPVEPVEPVELVDEVPVDELPVELVGPVEPVEPVEVPVLCPVPVVELVVVRLPVPPELLLPELPGLLPVAVPDEPPELPLELAAPDDLAGGLEPLPPVALPVVEAAPVGADLPVDDPLWLVALTVGRALPPLEAAVADPLRAAVVAVVPIADCPPVMVLTGVLGAAAAGGPTRVLADGDVDACTDERGTQCGPAVANVEVGSCTGTLVKAPPRLMPIVTLTAPPVTTPTHRSHGRSSTIVAMRCTTEVLPSTTASNARAILASRGAIASVGTRRRRFGASGAWAGAR